MGLGQIVFAINTAGTLAIGAICFFIVYTTFKGIQEEAIQEFSKRFMMSISLLLLYVSYFMMYNSVLSGMKYARLPMYLLLAMVFIYMIYAAIAFEKVAEKYGISTKDKIEKMRNQEGV